MNPEQKNPAPLSGRGSSLSSHSVVTCRSSASPGASSGGGAEENPFTGIESLQCAEQVRRSHADGRPLGPGVYLENLSGFTLLLLRVSGGAVGARDGPARNLPGPGRAAERMDPDPARGEPRVARVVVGELDGGVRLRLRRQREHRVGLLATGMEPGDDIGVKDARPAGEESFVQGQHAQGTSRRHASHAASRGPAPGYAGETIR